jgi:hypothetical protein
MTDTTFDLVGNILAYESGELDASGVLNLFSHLVSTGMAWSLQGSYGRAASRLIEAGYLDPDGTIRKEVNGAE